MNACCPDCGATLRDDVTCRECFDALLAYENERPDAFGPVHQITVASYFLQHPAGYGTAILRAWHELLDGMLSGRTTAGDLQKQMGRQFAGATRVRDASAVLPPGWPHHWPVTIHDVLRPGELPDVDDYVTRARTWAKATLDTLDAAGVTG